MAKDKAEPHINKSSRNLFAFDFLGAGKITFLSKKAYERTMYILDLFMKPGPDGKMQKTTMNPAVLASKDNPLLKASPSKAGGLNIELKAIPTKEFDKKYKLPKAGVLKRVPTMNPHVSQIKPKYTSTEKIEYPTTKSWVGAPFTVNELQPNRSRYVDGLQAGIPCSVCQGLIGMELEVLNCTTGAGPYFFPCSTLDGATPDASVVGKYVTKVYPTDPTYTNCQQSVSSLFFEVIAILPCALFQGTSEYPFCSQLKETLGCGSGPPPQGTGCATPFSVAPQPIIGANGLVDFVDPKSINGITDDYDGLDFTRFPTQPPHNGNCMATTTQFNSVIPSVPSFPYNVMAPVPIIQSYYELLDQLSQSFPNTSMRTKRGNIPLTSCSNCTAVCDNIYLGVPYKAGVIMYFYPSMLNVDPITGSGINSYPSSISAWPNGGYWYDTWSEMMDDLIAAGEYTGSNTDSLTDIWNAGIRLSFGSNGCIDCTFTGPSCTPAQSI